MFSSLGFLSQWGTHWKSSHGGIDGEGLDLWWAPRVPFTDVLANGGETWRIHVTRGFSSFGDQKGDRF